jgi:GNAT superfamily N-acetyltransferase
VSNRLTTAGCTVVDVSSVSDGRRSDLVARMYEELLIEAFPPAETTPLDVLQRSLTVTPPLARVAVTVQGTPRERPSSDGAGKLVAAVVGDLFPASRVLLISYLVVHPDMRGRGIGSATLSRVLPIWFEQHCPLATLAEVGGPVGASGSARTGPGRPQIRRQGAGGLGGPGRGWMSGHAEDIDPACVEYRVGAR